MRTLFLALLIVLAGLMTCRPILPTNHPCHLPSLNNHIRNIDQTVYVAIDPSFGTIRTDIIRDALRGFYGIGRTFVVRSVSDGPVDLSIRNWTNPERNLTIGFYQYHRGVVSIDSRRIGTDDQFQATIMHEIGHWLGMSHVCRRPNERSECSPVGYGIAIMNPTLEPHPVQHLTALDVLEYRRVMECLEYCP